MHRSITFAYNCAELTMMHEVAAKDELESTTLDDPLGPGRG